MTENLENLNLDMDTANVNMELSFVASAYKPKSILTVELIRANDIVSLVLNADKRSHNFNRLRHSNISKCS